ncbi:hypothetical protein, partial [Reyranella sp.]|uniref:hypothetical protein n=1 Tax=Reyranella sp. TaxID=1929291 RepID=UPI00272FE26E
ERPPPQGGRLQIGIGGRLPSEQLAGFKSESPADFKSEWVADLLRNPHIVLVVADDVTVADVRHGNASA